MIDLTTGVGSVLGVGRLQITGVREYARPWAATGRADSTSLVGIGGHDLLTGAAGELRHVRDGATTGIKVRLAGALDNRMETVLNAALTLTQARFML